MANTITVTKLVESPSGNATFHVYLESDGVSGDLTDHVIVDSALDFVPALAKGENMVAWETWHELSGFSLQLAFKSLTGKQPIWVLTPVANTNEFHCFGGLADRTGIDAQGKLVITTKGFTTTANIGAFVIRLRKTK